MYMYVESAASNERLQKQNVADTTGLNPYIPSYTEANCLLVSLMLLCARDCVVVLCIYIYIYIYFRMYDVYLV